MRFNAVLLYANLMSLFNSISFGDSCVVRVLRSLHRGCIRCSHAAAATVALKYDECTGVGLARIAWIGIIFVIRMLMPRLLSDCPSRATEIERACPGRYCLNLGPDHISSRTPRNDNPIPLSPEPPCRARRMADHSSPTQAMLSECSQVSWTVFLQDIFFLKSLARCSLRRHSVCATTSR
jgi:hypothetical protein